MQTQGVAMGTMRGQLLSLLILWQTYIEKRLLMASPYMYKPLVWKRFVGLEEIC